MKKGFLRSFCAASLTTSSVVLLVPLLASAQLVISEVAYDPVGSDDKKEWIELLNQGSTPIDISRWTFSDGGAARHAFNAPPKNGGRGNLVLAPGGFIIVADDAKTFVAANPSVAAVTDSTMNLKNPKIGESVSLMLFDQQKQAIDTFTYLGGTVARDSGDTAQRFGTAVDAGPPTPGAANQRSSVRERTAATAVPVHVTAAQQPKAKAPRTTRAKTPHSVVPHATETETAVVAAPQEVRSRQKVAGAADSAPNTLWYAGALGLSVVGALAAYLVRSRERDEWEIEDMAETV